MKSTVLISGKFSMLNRKSRVNIRNKHFFYILFFFGGLLNQLATNYVASFCVKPHRVLRLLCIPLHLLEVNSRRFKHTILLAVTRDYIFWRKLLSTKSRCRSIRSKKIHSRELHGRSSNFVMAAATVPNYVIRRVRLLVCPPARWSRRSLRRSRSSFSSSLRLSLFLPLALGTRYSPCHHPRIRSHTTVESSDAFVNCEHMRVLLPPRLNCATWAFHLQRARSCVWCG